VCRLRSRLRRDEQGSLIIALTVVMVVMLLGSLLFVQVVGNAQIISSRQAAYTGVTSADAGLSDALFRLDQPDEAPSSGVLCLNALNPSDSKCGVQATTTTPQLTGVSYVARTVPSGTSPAIANQWIVQAIGNARSGMHGAVQETLTRTALYPFALFGKKSLTFNGNIDKSDFGTFSPGPNGSSNFSYCSSTVATPACVTVGSDGSINCSKAPPSLETVYYNTGSGGGCGTSQSRNTNYNLSDPSPPTPPAGVSWTCPNGGALGSGANPPAPTILSGVYICASEVTITGTLTVLGTSPVQLYIMPSAAKNTVNSTFLDVAADSQINTTIPYSELSNPGTGPQPGDTMPDSNLFQVFTNSIGNLDVNGNHGFVFGGILYAPEATLTTNGCKSYFFGSATINTYTCNGGPNLGFYYDTALSQDFGPWQISGYQQINPSTVCIPDTNNTC